MNWNKIKEKYPKAFKRMNSYFEDKKGVLIIDRQLYDLFDEQGIYIEIDFENTDEFYYEIYNGLMKLVGYSWTGANTNLYPTRTETEEKAFEKAFEILDKKL